MPIAQLVEANGKYDAKLKEQKAFMDSARNASGTLDPSIIKLDFKSFQEKVVAGEKELTDLNAEVQKWVPIDAAEERQKREKAGHSSDDKHTHTDTKGDDPEEQEYKLRDFGSLVVKSKVFGEDRPRGQKVAYSQNIDVWPSQMKGLGVKTLFETGAGWGPESTRIGVVIDKVARPLQLLDLIPAYRTSQASVIWMLETTRTSNAAARLEGGNFAEDVYVLEEQTSAVRSIGSSIPVTEEQLDDVPMVSSYLNNRLVFGVRSELDRLLFVGDGISPNLRGILNTSGIGVQAKGADSNVVAIYKAITKCRTDGRSNPNAVVLHSTDWQGIRLLQDLNGNFIFGPPSQPGAETIWGLPRALNESGSAGTALVGDFATYCGLFERKGVEVQVGWVNAQFTSGKKTLRADMRAAFVVFRPTAFTSVTGL